MNEEGKKGREKEKEGLEGTMEEKREKVPRSVRCLCHSTDPPPAPYLQRPVQGLVVRGELVHSVLVVGVPLDERPHGLHLHPQVQPLLL